MVRLQFVEEAETDLVKLQRATTSRTGANNVAQQDKSRADELR